MPKRSSKRKDINELAKSIVDRATGQAPEIDRITIEKPKDPAAVELGRKGGQKGGRARAKKLTSAQRSEIARKAARARWDNRD